MTYYTFYCTFCGQKIISASNNGTCQFCLRKYRINEKIEHEEYANLSTLKKQFKEYSSLSDYKILKTLIPICTSNSEKFMEELEKVTINSLQKYRIITKLRQEGLLIGPISSK